MKVEHLFFVLDLVVIFSSLEGCYHRSDPCNRFFHVDAEEREEYFSAIDPMEKVDVYICSMNYTNPRTLIWRDRIAQEGESIVPHLFAYLENNPKMAGLIIEVFKVMERQEYYKLERIDMKLIDKLQKRSKEMEGDEGGGDLLMVIEYLSSIKKNAEIHPVKGE